MRWASPGRAAAGAAQAGAKRATLTRGAVPRRQQQPPSARAAAVLQPCTAAPTVVRHPRALRNAQLLNTRLSSARRLLRSSAASATSPGGRVAWSAQQTLAALMCGCPASAAAGALAAARCFGREARTTVHSSAAAARAGCAGAPAAAARPGGARRTRGAADCTAVLPQPGRAGVAASAAGGEHDTTTRAASDAVATAARARAHVAAARAAAGARATRGHGDGAQLHSAREHERKFTSKSWLWSCRRPTAERRTTPRGRRDE